MSDRLLQSNYMTSASVANRNKAALLAWSAYFGVSTIPAEPDDTWVRKRIVAEQVPLSPDNYVTQTKGYFLQDTGTADNVRLYLGDDNTNTPEVENTLATQMQVVIDNFIDRYALSTVTQAQIDAWREANNRVPPEVLAARKKAQQATQTVQ